MLLFTVFVQHFAEVTFPFFAALVAVYRVRFVLLKPNRSIAASHIEYFLLRFSITLSLAPIRA